MNYGSIVPSFYFYKFAEAVTQPYTSFAAYRAGNIDEKGNLLKPESSIDTFEYFVIKLKKIFEQLPYGITKYQLQNYVSTLNMFAEEAEHFNITSEQFHGLMEGLIYVECNTSTSYLELLEDMSAGGMAVAGDSPGYNQGGVSGMDPPMVPLQRRKPSISTDPYHMFDVSASDYEKIVGNKLSEIDYLRRFGARNPNSTLTVREPKSGQTYTLPKKKPLKEMFDLDFLNILNENSIVNAYNDADDKPGNSAIATLTDEEEKNKVLSTGKKTMVSLTIPVQTDEKLKNKEKENRFRLLGNNSITGSKVVKEQAVIGGIEKGLIVAGYKINPEAKTKDQLKIGEYGLFPEGGRLKDHSDIHVGMEHPEKKGTVYPLGIESGFNQDMQKQYLIPLNTKIKIPRILHRLGLSSTSSNLSTRQGQIDVGQEIRRHGTLSTSKLRLGIWPTLENKFPSILPFIKKQLTPSAHEAVRTKSDDLSIISNQNRGTVIHHRSADTFQRKLAQELLDKMGLHHTHDLDELTFSRSPYYGGSTEKPIKEKKLNK
jgi:hypothetical protein